MPNKNIGYRLATTFCSMDIINQNELGIYAFLFNYIFSGITYDLSILLIGFLINRIDISLCYLLTATPLRHFAGGYHAKTPVRCEIISYLTYFLIVIVSASNNGILLPQAVYTLYMIIYFLCWTITLCIAPVDTASKRLSITQKRKLKLSLIITFFIMTFIVFLFCKYIKHLFITTCICVIICTIGLCFAHIINIRQEAYQCY